MLPAWHLRLSASSPLIWHEWLCHSNFSFCLGASHPEDYIERANTFGYKSIGICDYDGVYGIVRAYRRQQAGAPRLKVFYGAEVHLQADHHRPPVYRDTLVFHALNHRGYSQLCQILSRSHQHRKNEAHLDLETLLKLPTDQLVCLQPMRGLIRRSDREVVRQRYKILRDHFPTRFYLVLSRHLNPLEDVWIPPTLRLSQELDIPCLFSQDAYFHDPGSKEVSDILQAIRLNRTIDEVIPHLFVNRERCLQPREILEQRYSAFSEAKKIIANSEALAARFSFSLDELRYQYPHEFLPFGYSPQAYLEELVWIAASERYPAPSGIPPKIMGLLQQELDLVGRLNFPDYFLTVWDIVRWARSQSIICQGRGSAANSAICFVLGISSVDPHLFDVLFERFISCERGDPPDIDVDFEHERREEVIQYIYRRYGRHRAAMVANVITFRSRSAIRCVGKALGVPASYLQEAAHLQEMRILRPRPRSDLPTPPEEGAEERPSHLPWEIWERLAQRIKGFPHHLGIHSCGFILTQDALDLICPQEPATMPGRTVIQWSKEDIEALNMFKIDILALGMLTVLRKAFRSIEEIHGKRFDFSTIPHDDAPTYTMIQKAQTVGTFQIESRAQMSMLPRLRPERFYDLAIQIGIIRPGPIQGGLIQPYIKRRKGLEPIVYADSKLIPILERTHGIPIFQEQIMRIAIAIGDFTPGEADQLRKQIGAWNITKDLGPLANKMAANMRRNKIPEKFVLQIMEYLQGLAHYGFPESHAISFALIAYASAYIKCHYKEAFYAALLNSQPVGFYSIHALVQAARREGAMFMPIDVRFSDWDTTIEVHAEDGGLRLRLGMHLVKGMTREGAHTLLRSRSSIHKPWADLRAFLNDSRLSRRDLCALAAAQALACFGLDRRSALWMAEGAPFAPLLDEEEACSFMPEDEIEQLERDFESYSTTLGEHPSKILRDRHWGYELPLAQLSRAHDLERMPDKKLVHVFGLVLIRQSPPTAKGMRFFTLEDETGHINLVFTPQIAERFRLLIHQQGFICASGRLQKEAESHSILVEAVHRPKPRVNPPLPLQPAKARPPADEASLLSKLPPARNYH